MSTVLTWCGTFNKFNLNLHFQKNEKNNFSKCPISRHWGNFYSLITGFTPQGERLFFVFALPGQAFYRNLVRYQGLEVNKRLGH